jgi:hypothetical protein
MSLHISSFFRTKTKFFATFSGTLTSVTTIRPGENFTIAGTGLLNATLVKYAGLVCPIVSKTDTELVATAPSSGFLFNEYHTMEVL